MGGGKKRKQQPDEDWQGQGHKGVPGAQGKPSAAASRYLAAEDHTEVLVKEKEGKRARLAETKKLGEDAGDFNGVTLKAFTGSASEGKRSQKRWELDPKSYDLVPWAAQCTRRTGSGEAENPKIRAMEELGPDVECFSCGSKTGLSVVDLDGEHLYNRRVCHYVLDHTKAEKPSWFKTKRIGVLAQQLKDGDAKVLCLFCNAERTFDAAPGQGTVHHNKIAK